jgi:erythromycin esterase-like protein
VVDAESYYRCMYRGRASSWNMRDSHMASTLVRVVDHLSRPRHGQPQSGRQAKAVCWLHNSHLGDARATEMGKGGEINLGQLIREHFGPAPGPAGGAKAAGGAGSAGGGSGSGAGVGEMGDGSGGSGDGAPSGSYLIGFSTYHGSVTAASAWDGDAERKTVRPGLRGSYEELFHAVSTMGQGEGQGESSGVGAGAGAGTGRQGDGQQPRPHPPAADPAINPTHVALPRYVALLREWREKGVGGAGGAGVVRAHPDPATQAALDTVAHPRLQRAIGVIYKPQTERWSHYFDSDLPRQFDALIHIDCTRALEPLERTALWRAGEEETFPTGF